MPPVTATVMVAAAAIQQVHAAVDRDAYVGAQCLFPAPYGQAVRRPATRGSELPHAAWMVYGCGDEPFEELVFALARRLGRGHGGDGLRLIWPAGVLRR
jgi:hypothetical protein